MPSTPDRTQPPDETSAVAPPAEDYSGRVIGDFELVRRIGVGGMGQVYLARQRSLKRQVAVKILRGELAANMLALRRFQAEAVAVATITHANIVQVYAIGEDDGLNYMALEYVDGRNLRDFLEKKGTPDLPLALDIMRQVASALERAGELGFVHRDVKPENILISRKGEVKVTDFGLSRCFTTDAPLNLTLSGMTMGTPLYMAPEQVRGQPVDPRTDIYSFGVTCYHMLAGEPPFRGTAPFDVALQHVQGEAKPLAEVRPDLPADLCAIVHRMMARRPEDRYQSAREILNDLARVKEGAAISPPRLSGGASLFSPTLSGSSVNVPALGPSGAVTQPLSRQRGPWRYLLVGVLVVAAVAGGAVLHWIQTPRSVALDPKDALADVDPPPNAVKEKELRRQLNDKAVRLDVAIDDLLDLAELLVEERHFDEAMKLFDPEHVRKLGAFEAQFREPAREREQLSILCGLGKGVVLAHEDKPEESNKEFLALVQKYPSMKKDTPAGSPKPGRGQLDLFFGRANAGANWKRAVGEAVERNARNLGGGMPEELKRLRMLPTKGPISRG